MRCFIKFLLTLSQDILSRVETEPPYTAHVRNVPSTYIIYSRPGYLPAGSVMNVPSSFFFEIFVSFYDQGEPPSPRFFFYIFI